MSSKKFYSDTAWNMGAFGVQAVTGALLNLVLMWYSGPEALGLFNQLYAVFVITGQLAAFGIQDSCQKHVAELSLEPDPIENNSLIVAGVTCAAATGLVGGLALLLLSFAYPGDSSGRLASGLRYLAPGAFFFVLNKVGLAILNGEQRMHLYAAGQALRAILVVGGCLAVGLSPLPKELMGAAFSLTEAALFVMIFSILSRHFTEKRNQARVRAWVTRHLNFGVRALPHGFLTETFIRIDVLMLSLFMSEAKVGIYSFVAFFLEGIFQIPLVVRTVTNPLLTAAILRRKPGELFRVAARSIATSGSCTFLAIAMLLAIFPWLIGFFPKTEPVESFILLKILLAGLAIYSLFLPIDNLLLQGGHPALQSVYMTITASVNVILNWYLIPIHGLQGAAIATATSFAISGPLSCGMAYYFLGFKSRLEGSRAAGH